MRSAGDVAQLSGRFDACRRLPASEFGPTYFPSGGACSVWSLYLASASKGGRGIGLFSGPVP